ncbi:HAD-IIB family hydrolase [Candidimonas humi]|uniref:HAD-IIB family hydrolase n=1 Tax=Candidimonas humi TaxID=683355 RepID=A0ABV8NVU7_9BURK|nr:HAD-IIB family hydrolase [Candidimonas humi]MBV6303514.1 HAD-IIB family hydrolase [Candidimonas humi]
MLPLTDLSDAALAGVKGVFTDIDDTLTTEGKLPAATYSALEALHDSGVAVVPITGRPAGWCDHIARMWPVDAVVGENGAFYFYYDKPARKLRQRFLADAPARAHNARRLAEIAQEILAEVPGCALASDQFCRVADVAIDFCEDVPPLPRESVERIVELMTRAGMTAKVSSIHVNGWFGEYDKLTMTRILMRERYGIDLDAARGDYIFVGDSPNDAPMFRYFPKSIGVANVREFIGDIEHPPAYVTQGRCGDGFVEVARRLLAARH